jgi:dihydropyrimidinase
MPDGLEQYLNKAAVNCAVDYGFHMNTFNVDELSPKEMDLLVDEGVTSFKMLMAYPGRIYSTDAQIFRMMQQGGHNGGLIMMHAENGIAIDVLRRPSNPRSCGASRPR